MNQLKNAEKLLKSFVLIGLLVSVTPASAFASSLTGAMAILSTIAVSITSATHNDHVQKFAVNKTEIRPSKITATAEIKSNDKSGCCVIISQCGEPEFVCCPNGWCPTPADQYCWDTGQCTFACNCNP